MPRIRFVPSLTNLAPPSVVTPRAAVTSVAADPSVTSRSVAALRTSNVKPAPGVPSAPSRGRAIFWPWTETPPSSLPPITVAPLPPPRPTAPPSAARTPPALSSVAPFSRVIAPPAAEIVPRFVATAPGVPPIERLPRRTRSRPRFTNDPGSRAGCGPQFRSTVPSLMNGGLMVPQPWMVWPARFTRIAPVPLPRVPPSRTITPLPPR